MARRKVGISLPSVDELFTNQVERYRIPKRNIARFFEQDATEDEVERRIVRALGLLAQAERAQRRATRNGA